MTIVQVDQEVAEQFFTDGGTLHARGEGPTFWEVNQARYKSLAAATRDFRIELGRDPEWCIDPEDAHPANPVTRVGPTSFQIS
jgi:hypothetical protein